MPWVFVNDLPEIQNVSSDLAVRNRVRFVPMPNMFLNGDEYEKHRGRANVFMGDDNIKDIYVRRCDVAATFAYMVGRAFRPEKTPNCDAVDDEIGLWVKSGDDDESVLQRLFERGGASDFLSCKAILKVVTDEGQDISECKLGKMIVNEFNLRSSKNRYHV